MTRANEPSRLAMTQRPNASVYERLGVPTIVNAHTTATRLSGGVMRPEVADAMREATQWNVDMATLEARASELIAGHTGAEAGYVTAGAAAALLLGTAACVTGLDPARMNRLPDTNGMKNEVVVPRSHRNFYDHAVRAAGVTLVEVGLSDRYVGAGVRDTEAWEIAAAITDRTAAVLYVAGADARPPLPEVIAVAHAAGVPVLVDAAAQLPPAGNLKRFIAEGADLVCYSGGKAIGGPQASGILCGKRDLVMAAALQHLDQDIHWEQWNPPPALFDKGRIPGLPHHGIGRPAKVGKEAVVGLLTALDLFVAEGDDVRAARWTALMQNLVDALTGIRHATVTLIRGRHGATAPTVHLTLDEAAAGMTALDLVRRLQDGEPSVHANPSRVHDGLVLFSPVALQTGDERVIAEQVRAILG
ncbi:Selenocysteine synthase (seryl-tRNASer selenium transferase)-like protein [alpha proteobacterium BAL199]|jgi:D-glucosaminate-6-phosphate ammonia-lyase|nr:Selenocysteine synthase (seryl-tRNASer selenium transferase)-like protein [alpha proteobacterium BAL199]